MVFDDKYFTSTDTGSYFTVADYEGLSTPSNTYQGIAIGESFNPQNPPLIGVNQAINHGLPTVMISMMEPSTGRGAQGLGSSQDRFSKIQQNAVAELLSVNKMNFAMHAPIVDIMGISAGAQNQQFVSSQKKQEHFDLVKKTIERADNISKKSGLKNIPITMHATNTGAINEKFDSGHRRKDGSIIYGTKNVMVDRDTGRLVQLESTFEKLPISQYGKKGGSFTKIEGTEMEGGYALFEVTPRSSIDMQNRTALNDLTKQIATSELQLKQLRNQGIQTGLQELQVEISTKKSKLLHLKKSFGPGASMQQFVGMDEYSKRNVPEQISKLAMVSHDTKTQPVIAVENEPGWQLGSNPELLIDWVDKSREMFAKKLVEEKGYDMSSAKKKASQLIGTTLDTGHLNTLKGHINPKTGQKWTNKDLMQQAKKMAARGVKFVHIADNIGEFGMDTHLLIGRGDTENKEFMKILKENGFKGQAVFEAFTHEGYAKVPAFANLMGLGAPMYSTSSSSVRDVGLDFSSPYSMRNMNYGHMLSQLHHSQWGGPFAGLQSTFGAQPQQSKDQFSGTPTS